ncbi:MAG: TlpA family protein disulfide reductase [candidate division WOR-3 bacterium]|nr:MAG: TlpA family protein disulfide reductase [candidate division WOR-3 bacterium]
MKKNVLMLLLIAGIVLVTCGSKENSKSTDPVLADFSLRSLDGNEIKLADTEGQVVLIDFWATWCPPCRNSIPTFIRLYNKYHEHGFTILGIGLDDEQALLKYRDEVGIPYPVLIGNNDVAKAYGVTGIPKTIFVDRKGRVRKTQVGFAPELEAQFDALIDSLINE